MIHGGFRAVPILVLLAGIGACEGGEVVIFAPAQAGSAGSTTAGFSGMNAGSGGSSGESAGTGGIALSGSGGGADPVARTCQSSNDCDQSWFCDKQDCSDASGVCSPIPSSDDSNFMPVCGCDRITYWNNSLRQAARVSAAKPGSCSFDALPCTSSSECGPFGVCRQILMDVMECGSDDPGAGQCWAIPNDCASPDDKPVGLPCPPPPGTPPAPPPCLTLCEALQADRPYVRLPPKWMCQ
jgi:hypothetical protein